MLNALVLVQVQKWPTYQQLPLKDAKKALVSGSIHQLDTRGGL